MPSILIRHCYFKYWKTYKLFAIIWKVTIDFPYETRHRLFQGMLTDLPGNS